MQERHINHEQYIQEQSLTTLKYVIPYINTFAGVDNNLNIAEIGCGEGGNLKPFLDMGCTVIGIDISESKIEKAHIFYNTHPHKENLTLMREDIYNVGAETFKNTSVVMMRDTLEHIPEQEKFMQHLSTLLQPNTKVFIGFPPWYMPFAGHQQICKGKFLSKLPFFHLLPRFMYKGVLKLFGEPPEYIGSLLEIYDTKLTINRYHRMVQKNGFRFISKDMYLVNPNYEIKFGFKPRKLPSWLNIPIIRDVFTTTYYSIIEKK